MRWWLNRTEWYNRRPSTVVRTAELTLRETGLIPRDKSRKAKGYAIKATQRIVQREAEARDVSE